MIIIDYKDRRPLYEQITERFKELILSGAIEPDTQLPSVRNLAIELSMNPNTIQRAYAELERNGFIYSVKGRGSFIAPLDELQRYKKNQIFEDAKKIAKQAKILNISKETFLEHMEKCYDNEI